MQYQKEEVRNRIMEAAFSEFEKSGYYRASMLQISTKAKVPIGNLYRYFKGKEVLFASCVETAYSCSLKLVNSVFDVWLETKDYEATIPTLLAEAKSLGRGLKLLTEKVAKLREMSPLWEMHKEGIDLADVKWSAH